MISLHDFVTDFVAVISSQSVGLGKMALGIVKIYLGSPFSANRRCSRSVGLRLACRGQLWTRNIRQCFNGIQLAVLHFLLRMSFLGPAVGIYKLVQIWFGSCTGSS